MYLERHIVTSMYDFVDEMEARVSQVKSYIDEFTQTAGRPEFHDKQFSEEEIIGHPVQAFHLIKRLTIQWRELQQVMTSSTQSWQKIEYLSNEYATVMPKEEDLHGAALALIRLQDTYNLNMTELASGRIGPHSASYIQMTARDCLYLGKHSFNNGYYGQAIEWFEEALTRAHREGNTTAPVDEITPFYVMAATIHDELLPKYEKNQTTTSKTALPPPKMRFVDGDNDDFRNYQALCRGEDLRTPEQEKKLKCYYTIGINEKSPWLILQPVRVEEVNSYPIYIAMFHDVLTESESDQVRAMAAPKLQRAKVLTQFNVTDEVSTTRTSQTAWFSADDYELVERINRRVSAVTGLSTDMTNSHSELMQVANYGMGGHYSPHYDYLIVDRPPEERHLVGDMEKFAGDRTATLMFYLSDVIRGGGTVFPRLGVRLTPKKNSAAFWFNLQRNGEGIEDTVHGACPVLMGAKWVANHWIRENGQIFKRKCTLNRDE